MWTDENRGRYDRSRLRYPSDLTDARDASPTAAIIDSQSVKGAEKGGRRLIRPVTTGERKSKARSGTFLSIRTAC